MSIILKTAILIIAVILAGERSTAPATPRSPDVKLEEVPVNVEQMRVYRDLLADYLKGSQHVMNLANKTSAFEVDEATDHRCLRGFPAPTQPQMLHRFPDSFGNDIHLRIVDPQTYRIKDPEDGLKKGEPVDDAVDEGLRQGLFTFSEVIFDTTHRRAIVQYSFHCGRLCGHGNTVILELHNGKWKQSKRSCGGWVS